MSINVESLAAWSISVTKAGKLRKVTEYIDMMTGEIIPADTVQIPVLDLRGKQAQKDMVLGKLRPEVRAFAYFVLGYANKRRGITPGINTLCHWYADLTGKRADNIRRCIPKLEAAGVLANENLLGPLFQRTGGSARAHLGEEAAANARYMMQKAARSFRIEDKARPAWLADSEPTGNLMTHEIYCDLMQRISSGDPVTLH
ncbi:hypothetical protein D9X30_4847 [Cupriavidus sp. U2]|uniref:hypothetical protein n=1 Tax=Cupriavidus sp. U2 TaxID=2920269 RepID=UPI00129D9EBD|nr:hypothetical protein [Cupriavidus sp. U2]KAI3590239.1 hypothetical protein D9X30_4847 [Cupriavidus sp. U2]